MSLFISRTSVLLWDPQDGAAESASKRELEAAEDPVWVLQFLRCFSNLGWASC